MDYAANAGGMLNKQGIENGLENGGGPADIPSYAAWALRPTGNLCYVLTDTHYATGIVYQVSTVRQKDITDGLSKTYAVGEKFEAIDQYGTGNDPADNEWMFVGYDNDTNRSAQPITPNTSNVVQDDRSTNTLAGFAYSDIGRNLWGSAHRNTMNMVFCDGSVHEIPYSIDPTCTWRLPTAWMATRQSLISSTAFEGWSPGGPASSKATSPGMSTFQQMPLVAGTIPMGCGDVTRPPLSPHGLSGACLTIRAGTDTILD